MTTPIETVYPTGASLYAVIHGIVGGLAKVWDPTLSAGAGGWATYNGANWAQYAVAMTEQASSGYYSATYPANIDTHAVLTTEVIYNNGTPTLGDAAIAIAQSQGTNVAAVDNDPSGPEKLKNSLKTMVIGNVIAGTLTATAFTTDVVNANTNAYQGRSLLFVSGTLKDQGGTISEYDVATQKITVAAAFTGAPSAADIFIIV